MMIMNDGKILVDTDYWDGEMARRGLCFMSGNAGAWRLLVPDCLRDYLEEMNTTNYVEIELRKISGRNMALIWFEDGSQTPFHLGIETRAIDRHIDRTNVEQPLMIYTRDGLKQTHRIRRIL